MTPLEPDDPVHISGYRLMQRLGIGGMGIVYLGEAAHGREVAVKVIRNEFAADAEFRVRFRREVASMLKVASPRVVPVVGADPDGEPPWLATEYLPVLNLGEIIEVDGPMKKKLKKLTRGLAEALEAIHAAGLTHRDLKPGNILMTDDGPRVIDFGLAVALDDTKLTGHGYAVGTIPFMSPEQASGKKVGPGSDVYALGAVVVFAATGLAPSQGGLVDTLPASLQDVIKDCLEINPDDRPTPQEIRARLASDSAPTPAKTKVLSGSNTIGKKPARTSSATSLTPKQKATAAKAGPGILGIIGALVFAIFAWGGQAGDAVTGRCVNKSFGDEQGWNLDMWCGLPMPFVSNYHVLYLSPADDFPKKGCASVVADWNPATDVQAINVTNSDETAVSFCARPFK